MNDDGSGQVRITAPEVTVLESSVAGPLMNRLSCPLKALGLWLMLLVWGAPPLFGQNHDPADVRVPLDSALRIAHQAAARAFPELSQYLLYSIAPRVGKSDPSGGLHWQVQWQERAFPHHRWLVVRVYMKDGHTTTERLDDP